jgi:molybdopterin/thiamine biosynthesis adenylyltransferase
VGEDSDLRSFDIVFDCVDNFASRIVLSEMCRRNGQMLLSGGSGAHAGQVVVCDPARGDQTPAEVLGLYDLVGTSRSGDFQRERASCRYQPEPAVIMTNQVIAGLMVDACRRRLAGGEPHNIFYDALQGPRWL